MIEISEYCLTLIEGIRGDVLSVIMGIIVTLAIILGLELIKRVLNHSVESEEKTNYSEEKASEMRGKWN